MATKRELEQEVRRLKAVVRAFEPDRVAAAHLARLDAAAAPYERRLAQLPALEAAVAEARGGDLVDEEGAAEYAAALADLKEARLSGTELTALTGLYKQRAEIEGLLKSRRPHGAKEEKPSAAPLQTAANLVRLKDVNRR